APEGEKARPSPCGGHGVETPPNSGGADSPFRQDVVDMANIADLENEDKPLSRSDGLALLVRVFKENAPRYWPRYAAALVLMGLVAAATGASAWIMKSVINDVFIARDQAMIQMVALGVFVIFFVRGFADYGQVVIMNSIGRRIIGDHQKRLYIHLLDQGMAFFNSASLGQV